MTRLLMITHKFNVTKTGVFTDMVHAPDQYATLRELTRYHTEHTGRLAFKIYI